MSGFLKQATAAQPRALGPFIDSSDGITPMTGLTIANTDIKLVVNGGASANKNSGGGTHRVNGVYGATFDATDTATVGEIEVSVVVAGALPVFKTFTVLEEAVYDALFAASAAGYQVPIWAAAGSTVNLSGTTVATATNLTNPATLTTADKQALIELLYTFNTTADYAGSVAGSFIKETVTNVASGSGLDAAGVRAAVGLATANLDTQLSTIDNFIDGEIAQILSDIGTSGVVIGTKVDQISTDVAAIIVAVDTEVAAIKTKTDFLPSVTAGAAGGIFIAGANAATTVNFTGNLSGSVGSVTGAVGSVTGNVGGSVASMLAAGWQAGIEHFFTHDATATYASGHAGGLVKQIADNAGGGGGGASVDDILDELLSGHQIAGSVGKGISDAGAAGNPWSALLEDNDDPDTFGEIIGVIFGSTITPAEFVEELQDAGLALPTTDINDENIPPGRTFDLVRDATNVLVGAAKAVASGTANDYAWDFRNDLTTNGKIQAVGTPTIFSGSAGGLTFGTPGREDSQAKVRVTFVAAGTYIVQVPVTYPNGATQIGRGTFKVVSGS